MELRCCGERDDVVDFVCVAGVCCLRGTADVGGSCVCARVLLMVLLLVLML